MKYGFYILFLAIVAAGANATLEDDIKDFEALIPKTKIAAIAAKHLLFDKQFRDFKNFLGTKEFAQTWETLLRNKEFRTIVEYVGESGADLIGLINGLAHLLKVAEYPKDVSSFGIMPRSVMSFVDEVINAMPKDKMSKLMKHKMETSPEFKKLHDRLAAAGFHDLVMTARHCEGLAPVEASLNSKGLNVDKLLEIGRDILTWAN